MKRECLEDLRLEKDTIDKIMTKNGKDIEAGKAKLEEEQRLRQTIAQAVDLRRFRAALNYDIIIATL